jgi:hypothetical protein
MSTVRCNAVKPGRRSLQETPENLEIGTEIEAGKSWSIKKGDPKPAKKGGGTYDDDYSGVMVKADGKKFSIDFGELLEDLTAAKATPKQLAAAGIKVTEQEEGYFAVEVKFPSTTIGRAAGKYVIG